MEMPLAIDLFCGLGGWTEGLLAEGYFVVGFDIERHVYGEHHYPAQLVLQDVLSLHGRQFRDASLIVASPPCQAYSYRAMPWKRAKALPPPDNSLFEACFRIQREAREAAGRHIPLVVENVKGAQPWVGRARWNFGSYYLWGDVPALMPMTVRAPKVPGQDWSRFARTGEVSPHGRLEAIKNAGGSWFRVSHNKVAHTRGDRYGNPPHTSHMTNPDEHRDVKHQASGRAWFDGGPAAFGSGTNKRRAASALIAKIPLALARHIAAVYHPSRCAA